MKYIAGIIGGLLLLPIAIILVVLIMISLVGGYFSLVPPLFWAPVLGIVLVIIAWRIIKRFFD